jgi:tetratricopeptide (TPR) repeat protein
MNIWLRCFPALALLLGLMASSLAQQPTGEDAFTALLHRGFAYHQQADYDHALPLLRQAWKLDPHDYFVNLLLGIDLLRTGNPEQAIDYLTVASHLRPKEDFPYEYRGEAQALLARYDQAAASYMKAVAVAPAAPEAIEAWIDFSLERFRQLAGQLRSSQKGLAAEYRLQARSYAADDEKRRELLQQSSALDPQAPGIWSELALADVHAGDQAEARKNVALALAADAFDRNATTVQAMIGARSPAKTTRVPQGRSSDTLFREQRWGELTALPPPPQADRQAWFQRGVALAQSGQCEPAIPALERGLSAPKENVYARFLLSWCYADVAGKVDARIRQSGGDLAIAHMIRGDVLFRMQGDTAGAMAEYQAALALRKDDPKLLERLAEVQVAAGDLTAAEQNAGRALSLDAHRYSARQTLGRIAMEQGRYADALPLLNLLAAQDPHDQGTQISLATTLAQLGNSSEALQHLEPVLASGYPDQKGSLHSLLGALLRKAGRPTEAAQAFATARQLSQTYQQSAHRDQD